MTKIIDLPTTASTDANTFVHVYKNGKTQKVSATVFGGGGSGLDLTSTTDVPTVEGTEYLPLNKPLGTVFRVTVQRILDWILARANTWNNTQTFNSNINLTGTARRITGDFSNATVANRMLFQTSSENTATSVGAVPNGTSTTSAFVALSKADIDNASYGSLRIDDGAYTVLESSKLGTGQYLPLTFHAGGSERLRIDPTTGNVLATSGALGYGVGAGGTVVQATSKSTAVTLNKPSGKITMNAATLNSGASVQFAFINSNIGPNDGIALSLSTLNLIDSAHYRLGWSIDAANTNIVYIGLYNQSGVNLSQAVTINFQVIKGATA